MFFCSTCKRVVGVSKRKPNRKTCSSCLKKSADRARSRRARRHVDVNDRSLTCTKGASRLCSSCKCEKALENFFGNNKSCEMCLLRHRRAKMLKASTGLEELFCGEMCPLAQIKSSKQHIRLFSRAHTHSSVLAQTETRPLAKQQCVFQRTVEESTYR